MKKILLLLLLVLFCVDTDAQYSSSNRNKYQKIEQSSHGFDVNKMTIGGGLGFQFGDYTTINIAPQVGYNFNKYLNAGAGITYTYYRDKYYSYGSDKITNTRSYLGFNLYAKIYPVDFLVLMVQPEANRMWSNIKNDRTSYKYSENKFVPVVLVGGGFRLGPMTAMIQYDVVQDDNSPYGDRLFYSLGYTWSF